MLAYALGGGLGHVTRVRALAATLGWRGPLTILTSNPDAADPRVCGTANIIVAPVDAAQDPRGLEAFVRRAAVRVDAEVVLVDAFPRGILHELRPATFGERPLLHSARALRWPAYAQAPGPRGAGAAMGSTGGRGEGQDDEALHFGVTYVVEPIGDAQRASLATCSDELVDRAVVDIVEPARRRDLSIVDDLGSAVGSDGRAPGARPQERWLVVHSGPDEETLELVAYANDVATAEAAAPAIVVVSPRRPASLDRGVAHLDVAPAWPLFAEADRVFAGAGSNVVRQLARHRDKTSLLPFDRRYDDQYERARRFTRTP
jgi:hypothetical protein